ncbi:epididymal protein 13 isoform X7 [Perognathus longimembris pacificus]|uniref:epididymal protein 13 isoform X7 n=1 Tax=Perognathus longimembris pacificus TaxID=214514 RepID=UPI002018C37A|nr:epididymal protein 13 isoform X7 [Perognathus longimembris pacificus]
MCRPRTLLEGSLLLLLLFLGLAGTCNSKKASEEKLKVLRGILGMMNRLTPEGLRQNMTSSLPLPLVPPQDRTEDEEILGLLTLQVVNKETSIDCKEAVNPVNPMNPVNPVNPVNPMNPVSPVNPINLVNPVNPMNPVKIPPMRPSPRRSGWNFLKCAYMMVTFIFVSYNRGDWCYCHYCNLDLDFRHDPCCAF